MGDQILGNQQSLIHHGYGAVPFVDGQGRVVGIPHAAEGKLLAQDGAVLLEWQHGVAAGVAQQHHGTQRTGHIDAAYQRAACANLSSYLVHNGMRQFAPEELCPDDGSITPLKDQEQRYLYQLLETAKSMEAEVVFYTAPVYYRESSQVGRKNYVKNYIEQKGFPFVDFSGDKEAIGLDLAEDFWSPDHFDSLGALKVTKHFSEYLKTRFTLPDRREDPAYADWLADLPSWQTQLQDWTQTDRRAQAPVAPALTVGQRPASSGPLIPASPAPL